MGIATTTTMAARKTLAIQPQKRPAACKRDAAQPPAIPSVADKITANATSWKVKKRGWIQAKTNNSEETKKDKVRKIGNQEAERLSSNHNGEGMKRSDIIVTDLLVLRHPLNTTGVCRLILADRVILHES
ncbi:hypothetical protein OAF83_02480 [Rubripirellula sp.]|nr:hypothetical protein [Rubripirellula sp.]MDB4749751.1 hypothetical protein [Rubripirellula sp.]